MIIRISKFSDILHLKWNHQIFFWIYTLVMLFFSGKFVREIIKGYDYQSYQVTEMLINYGGGFLRRGLSGDIIWMSQQYFGWSPYWVSCVFCIIFFVSVTAFFIIKSIERKISLYYFPLIYLCIINILRRDWLRKDCLMLLAIIICFYIVRSLYKKKTSAWSSCVAVNIVCSITLLQHEAFFFFSIPLIGLFVFKYFRSDFSSIKSFIRSFIFIFPSLIVFMLVIINKGDSYMAQAIWQSWGGNEFFGSNHPTGAIDAIGWTTDFAVKKHINANFIGNYIDHGHEIMNKNLLWIICLIITYFMTFKWNHIQLGTSSHFKDMNKSLSMSTLIMFQFVMLLPMFTILSCDYARIYYYLFGSCYSAILIFDDEIIISLFPRWFIKFSHYLIK